MTDTTKPMSAHTRDVAAIETVGAGDPAPDAPPAQKSSPAPKGSTRALVALLAFVLGFATVPHRVCERDALRWFRGDPALTSALAAGLARTTATEIQPGTFATGSARFDAEWLFGTYMMAAMGFGQVALDAQDGREENLSRMERCLDALLSSRVHVFDDAAWGASALTSLEPGSTQDRGHAAYLGYAALALSLHRVLKPSSRFAGMHDAMIAALARRIDASPTALVETYPGEVYPVDNAAVVAALALHARATGRAPWPAGRRALDAIRSHGIDPATGLLVQAVTVEDARPRDAPRASGTALASYFLSFADPRTSLALFRALERHQFRTVLGFGGMTEYPPSRRGHGDIDSGPVFLGFGVSASGFAIGASRAHGDRDTFTALGATAHLFGAPLDEDGARTYVTGGPIGDAILFAMFTAPRAGRFS